MSTFSYKFESYMYLVKIHKFCCSLSSFPKKISVKILIAYLYNNNNLSINLYIILYIKVTPHIYIAHPYCA